LKRRAATRITCSRTRPECRPPGPRARPRPRSAPRAEAQTSRNAKRGRRTAAGKKQLEFPPQARADPPSKSSISLARRFPPVGRSPISATSDAIILRQPGPVQEVPSAAPRHPEEVGPPDAARSLVAPECVPSRGNRTCRPSPRCLERRCGPAAPGPVFEPMKIPPPSPGPRTALVALLDHEPGRPGRSAAEKRKGRGAPFPANRRGGPPPAL